MLLVKCLYTRKIWLLVISILYDQQHAYSTYSLCQKPNSMFTNLNHWHFHPGHIRQQWLHRKSINNKQRPWIIWGSYPGGAVGHLSRAVTASIHTNKSYLSCLVAFQILKIVSPQNLHSSIPELFLASGMARGNNPFLDLGETMDSPVTKDLKQQDLKGGCFDDKETEQKQGYYYYTNIIHHYSLVDQLC